MITELTVAGFMGIPPESEETPAQTLTFGRFNVIIGANGSGKTTILRALGYFNKLLTTGIYSVFTKKESFVFNKSQRDSRLRFSYKFIWPNKENNRGVLDLNISDNRNSSNQIEGSILSPKLEVISSQKDWSAISIFTKKMINKHIEQAIFLHLDANQIKKPSDLKNLEIQNNGEGLTGYLAEISMSNPDKINQIYEEVKTVIPNFERVRFARASDDPTYGMIVDMKHGKGIHAEAISEGTLLVIALMTVLHAEPAPNLLLLDNIDQGLHPTAQEDLIKNLRKILEIRPNLQIVATSHSPYLVDYLKPEELIVAAYDARRGTPVYGRLDTHPEYPEWKDILKLGEFWSHVGEQWLVPAAPTQPQEASDASSTDNT